MNFLTSSVVKVEDPAGPPDFAAIQHAQIRAFRAASPAGAAARVSQGLVVIPTDSASAAQRAQVRRLRGARAPRTTSPQGPAKLLFAPDILGTSEQIAEALYAHAAFTEVTEVAFALPFSFDGRRLRADAHRHRDPARAGAGLAASRRRLTSGSTCGHR